VRYGILLLCGSKRPTFLIGGGTWAKRFGLLKAMLALMISHSGPACLDLRSATLWIGVLVWPRYHFWLASKRWPSYFILLVRSTALDIKLLVCFKKLNRRMVASVGFFCFRFYVFFAASIKTNDYVSMPLLASCGGPSVQARTKPCAWLRSLEEKSAQIVRHLPGFTLGY